jgi:LysM repeat protein
MTTTIDPLLQTLQNTLETLHQQQPTVPLPLNSNTLGNPGSEIISLFQQHLGVSSIALNSNIAIVPDTEKGTLVVQGISVNTLLKIDKPEITATFSINNSTLAIELIIKTGSTWKLTDSFSSLSQTIFNQLTFVNTATNRPYFILNSANNQGVIPSDLETGLNLAADLNLSPPADILLNLIPGVTNPLPLKGTVQINASNEALAITGKIPDFSIKLPNFLAELSFENAKFVLHAESVTESSVEEGETHYLTYGLRVQGDVNIEGSILPLAVELPLGLTGWTIMFIPGQQVSFERLLPIVPGMDLISILPDQLSQKFDSVEVTNFTLQLTRDKSNFNALYLSVGSDFEDINRTSSSGPLWAILPGILELKDLSLNLSVIRDSKGGLRKLRKSGSLQGTFFLGNALTLSPEISFPVGDGNWSLQCYSEIALPNLESFAHLLGGNGANVQNLLPAGVGEIGGFTLSSIGLEIDPKVPSLVNFSFDLYSTQDWVIIPNQLVIKNIFIDINIIKPTTLRTVFGSIRGTIGIGKENLDVIVQKYDAFSDWNLAVRASNVELPNLGDLASLVGANVTNLLPDSLTKNHFIMNDFEIDLNLTRRQISQIYFLISCQNWVLVDGILEVKEIDVSLNLDWTSGSLLATGKIFSSLSIGNVIVDLSAERNQAGNWLLTGQLDPDSGQVNLTKLVEQFMGITEVPPLVPDVILSSLSVSVDTGTSTYQFATEIEIDWSQEKAIGDFSIPKFTAKVNIESTLETPNNTSEQALSKRVYQGFFEGDVEFEKDFILTVRYEFVPNNKNLILKLNDYTCAIRSKQISPGFSETIIDLNFGDLSLGKLITYIVNKVDPEADFELDEPWNILNDLNLRNLTLEVNVTQGTGGVWYDLNENLGFVDIKAVGIFYQKSGEGQEKSVDFKIEGNFLATSYTKDKPLQWDLLNESPPSVAGKTTTVDLRFLAVGQHIGFKDTTEFTKVYDVLNKLGDSYKPQDISKGTKKQLSGSTNTNQPVASNGDKPSIKSPLDPLDALQFDPNAGWLIGADLTLVDAVTVGVIFNDPELYGLYISLSGPKVKILDGLSFQILYKKINDHLGEYFLELKLPDIMRHWEFGEVSLTLPIIDISIYTNGNFKLDFGFPYNNDFSRSFSVQAFPFEGAGGFYFAMLNGDTSNHVPVISNGRFDPVIEFGLGLQIGVGKDINEGVLSAGIDITLAGVLQGVIAVFNPDSNALVPENYYLIQGAIAIVGKLYGKIDLAIIKIDISVTLYASVQLVVECYQPIYITLSAGVEVRAFIQIVFIKIDFHFSATITQKFSIGQASPTPWNVISPPQPLPSLDTSFSPQPVPSPEPPKVRPSPMMAAMATPTAQPVAQPVEPLPVSVSSRPIPDTVIERPLVLSATNPTDWTWSANFAYNDSSNKEVKLYFVPCVTASSKGVDGTVDPQVVSLLFLENSINQSQNNQTQSDFDKLAQTLLVWALQAYLKVADAASLNQAKITEDDLNFIDKRLSGVITEGVIAGLLNISLADATVILQSLVIQGVLGKNGSILDANKAFNLDQNQDQQVIANLLKSWQVPFGFDQLMGYLQTNFVFKVQDQSSNPTSINASIFPLFKSLNLGYKDKQTGESKVISFSQSIKDAFGEDYLPQLIKYLKALSSQQEESLEQDGVIISDESLAEVLFKDYFSLLINTAVQNAYRLLRAFSYQINEGDYLTRIVSQYYDVSEGGVTDNVGKYLLEMCLANQNQPGVLNDKGYAIIKQFTHQITTAETSFNQIAQTLSNSQIKVDIKALATSNLYNTHLLALGQSVSLPSVSYTAPPSDTTLTSLAQQFYTSADRIVILGGQPTRDITNNGDSPSLAPLTKVSISGINFSYNPTTGNLKSLAEIGHYFGVSETILQGLNPDFDATKNSTVTIPAINYTVPPTDINSVATYFGVGVEQVQQNGNQYTITNAQYTVDANDTLFSIARYFSVLPSGTLVVKPEDLVSANADKKGLLQVGGSLVVQDYKCAIATRDTLGNIAQNHYCALTDIITWNKDNPQLLKPQKIWVIPSVRLSVSQLIQTLASHPDAPNFNNIASTVSRFLVHGMSLPIAQQDFTQPLATWQVQSLYAAVGQQFSASVASLGDGVTLSVASPSPVLQLPDNATFKLTPDQLQFVQDLPTVAGKLQTNAIRPFTPFIKTNTQHSLQNSFLWNSVDHNIPFQSQQGSQSLAGNPTIWTLPAGLLHQLRQLGKQETLMLNLKTGSSDAQGRDMITTDVNYYAWATLIKFSVKEYISSGINGEMISNVYQLQGVDHDSVELLSRLLAAKEDNLTLYLVYTADNRGNSASLQSDMFAEGDSQSIQLIKTNLAGIGDQYPEIAAASLKEAQTFLRLLYESSDVQSGGYYLYYQTQQNPDGFPASVFSQSVNATLNLLVLSTDTNQVARSRNCVVTRTAIDTSQMVFFAESPQCPAAQLTISPGNIGFEWSLAKPDLEPKVSEVLVLDIGSQLKSGDDGITLTANTNATKAITTTPGVNPKKVVKFTIPANLTSNYLNIAFYVGDSFTHSEDLTKTNYIRCQVMAADASSVGKVIKISNGHHPRPQPQEVTLTDSWQLVEQFIPADQLVSDPNTTSPFVIFVNPTSADESFSFYVSLEPGELTYLEKQNSSLELAAFESLFQMLGYRVQENADFGNGMWAVPLGPTLPHDAAKVPLGESTDADWHYSHIIPLPSPKSSPTEGQSNAFMPSADENPYRAITKTIKSLEFTFNLQDVYGNRLTNIFKDSLSIPIQYYDPVIPLSQWNSVAASYTITGNKNDLTKPLINVLIDFNGVKYLPRLDKSLSDCLKQAQKDLEGYKTIYYQLSQGDVSVFLETSLGNIDTPSQKDPLVSLIAQIYGFLTTLTWPSGGLIAVTHTTGSNNTTDSLSSLAQAYPATFGEIAQINATIPDFFASDSLNIPTFYTVRFKDTLASIVANNPLPANSGVTAYNSSTVASLNQDLPGLLRPGVLLVMGNDQTHLIAANDTLASIAKQYNSTVESLASLIANQDILASGAHIALFVEQKAPGTGKSITDLANSCTGGATITEFTRFNGLQPIKNNLILMIPNALILADNLPKEASIYAITDQNNTLGKIAVNEDHIKDLFNVNLYLMNIIQDKVTFSVDLDVKNPDGSWAKSTVQYTTKESDNLYSIYTFFVAQVSLNGAKLLTTQAQFASLIKDVALFKQVTVLMPPTPLTLSSTIQPQNHAEIFSLTVSLKITRDPNLVSKQLLSDQKSQQLIEQKLMALPNLLCKTINNSCL